MRRPELIILAGAALAAAGAAIPARADNAKDKLFSIELSVQQKRVERNALAQTAAALAAEIEGLRQQSVSAAEAMQRHEAALSMLETQLKNLGDEATRKAAELQQDEIQRGGLLMALVALARNPPEALALSSPDPIAAERSALLLGNAVPPLDEAAHRLNADLKQLASLRLAIGKARERHRAEQDLLTSQQLRLTDLIARKSELQHQAQIGTEQSEARLAALAAEAQSLKDLIERLDAERKRGEQAANAARLSMTVAAARLGAAVAPAPVPAPSPSPSATAKPIPVAAPATVPSAIPPDPSKPAKLRSFLYAAGSYMLPASGRLVQNYGKPNEVGLTSQGLGYETRAGAQVVAPYDGRVLFAGPFKDYGEILIVEHSDGYHSLLAGLTRLDVSVGQWLITGEPVGVMPKGEDKPRLYLELRHDGQPINPLPWLATPNEKVSG